MNKKSLKDIYYYWLDWNFSAKIISTLLNVTLWSIAALLVVNYITNVNQTTEYIGAQLVTLGDQTITRATEKVGEGVKVLETLAKTPLIVEAIKEANTDRAAWTSEEIDLQDKAWIDKDPSIERTVKGIAGNQVSAYLIDFRQSNPEEAEVFVTDKRGLNVAMTDRTSDFLQTGEEWWESAFADGNGSTYLGQVEYDESSRSYAMNIGIPIMDPDTQKVIGILRGTLDISIMINTLGNVKVGETGTVVLMDSRGTVLYSHNPDHFMKTAPEAILALFKPGQSGWKQTTDLDGNPAIVAYNISGEGLVNSLGWRLLVTQSQAEANRGVLRSLLLSSVAGILVAGAGILLSSVVLTHSISAPLGILTKSARELSVGNIIRDVNDPVKDRMRLRKDEIGAMSKAFERLIVYFQNGVTASTAIANKDLTILVTPNSEKDELGIAFAKMVSGLRQTIGQVAESAEAVSGAASQLAMASEQSGRATSQIALTIQQVALGTAQQSEDVGKTSSTVEQMDRAIAGIAKGTGEQAQAVGKASRVTAQISSAIQQVTANAQSSARGAAESIDAARAGVRTVEATLAGMQTIKTKVGLSARKVREMGERSEQIDTIVETIEDIASQTNLLALNAAIEAARVQGNGEKTVETLLQQHMLGAVNLVADILASGHELNSEDLVTLARRAQVADLCISDSDGVITASNQPGSLGFRFSEDAHQESSVFRPLLNQQDGVVVRPIVIRDQDHKPYVYVGVSRRDHPGIVQAGTPADLVYSLGGYSRGFAVVADEVRKLAEHARAATKEITVLIRDLQKKIAEAVLVMEDGARDVESRSAQTSEAGESLAAILKVTEMVSQQVGEIAKAVQHMGIASNELVSAMETVSAVVEENTAAAEVMAGSSNKVRQAMENIASVSEENSAAVEEVSASSEEVSAQVEEVSASAASLTGLAQSLQQIVAQFRLNLNDDQSK